MAETFVGVSNSLESLNLHHEQISTLLIAIRDKDSDRQELVHELFVQLRVHSILEQQLLFSGILPIIGQDRVRAFCQDFFVMLAYMLELEQLDGKNSEFDSILKTIADRFAKHVKEQESILFPELEVRLSCSELSCIESRYRLRRDELSDKMRAKMEHRAEGKEQTCSAPFLRHSRCA